MERTAAEPAVTEDAIVPETDEIRMGSEYASARDYLARTPRAPSPRDPKPGPKHGSNDSDFGFTDRDAE